VEVTRLSSAAVGPSRAARPTSHSVTTAVQRPEAFRAPNLAVSAAPKILFYSHDTVGLGNIRRTLLLSQTLAEEYPSAAMLLVTGSPMIHAFRIPENLDYIKLPCVDRTDVDCYKPTFLATQTGEVDRIRRAILVETVIGFRPDLLIVDKRPGGVGGELLDALRALRRRPTTTRVVLGMRDILDEPERTRSSLRRTRDMATIARTTTRSGSTASTRSSIPSSSTRFGTMWRGKRASAGICAGPRPRPRPRRMRVRRAPW
jgi:hypothetical protein